MSNPSPRAAQLSSITESPLDVLIIGGGIVGAGVARDAAQRGLKTAIVDRHDFAFGTSSRSSRLLHGGLRYLAQGRLRLVRESSVEKMTLHRIAPHLAQPLTFIFPTYRGTQWKRWKLSIGVKLYDLLCGKSNLGPSASLDPEEVYQILPNLERSNLTGAVRYFDGFTNDARLVLDTVRSASTFGAVTLNYVSLADARRSGDSWQCVLHDEQAARELLVAARVVINAGGPWASQFPASRVRLRLTKGIHVVIDATRLPIPSAVVMTEGPRILFAIPWGQRVILGTTDTDYDGPLDAPACEPRDVAYVLEIVNRIFPTASLTTTDILSGWAGVRPLIADPNGRPSDISREHRIQMTEPGWFDVAGGKLTTYRLMAEQTIDQAARFLGQSIGRCRTATLPLVANETASYSGVVPPAPSKEAVEHFCQHEWAQHLDDIMIRCTGWTYYHRDHHALAAEVAHWMGQAVGWDEILLEQELARYRRMTAGIAPTWEPPPMAAKLAQDRGKKLP